MPKRFGVRVGYGATAADHQQVLEKVRIAEELGVESVWTAEAWGRDAFSFLTELALSTTRMQLGTGIVNVFSRSAGVLAMTAASIDELSGGRMILGLGSSGAHVIEHLHGVPFEKPLRRLREYVEIINMLIAGQPLNYEGEIFGLKRGFTLRDFTPVRPHIPIYIAAITPASIRQTGAIADGVIPIYWPKERLPQLVKRVRGAAEEAGRQPDAVTVALQVNLSVGDGDAEALRNQARQPVAFYIGRMGSFYQEMLARNGYEPEVAASLAAWQRRDAAGAAAAVSERMLLATTVVGTLDQCAEQLDERFALGADLQLIPLPPGAPAECGRVLERLLR
jgi:F420-dependent oxidoreductase-like protein